MTMLDQLREQLKTRLDERSKAQTEVDNVLATAEARGDGTMTAEETATFDERRQAVIAIDSDVDGLKQRIADLEDNEARRAQADAVRSSLPDDPAKVTTPAAVVRNEPTTYARNSRNSFFADAMRATLKNDPDAQARLQRSAKEVEVEAEKRVSEGKVEFRDLTRTDGAGGYLVPPLWLVDQYVALARAGRITANLVRSLPLPPGTDSINIPTISTGTATAIQSADNASVQETDLVDASVSAPVRTIAGQQDLAIQLLDQSPIAVDEIVFADLMAAFATNVGTQIISGSGSSGQITGIRNVSSITTVTYTDASPTAAELYSKLADAIQQMHTNRFLPPNAIVMHPRRWGWFLAALDSSGRPLVVPNSSGPWNAMGNANPPASEGMVGTLMGLPVYVDPNIPITVGGGTEDVILVLRTDDLMLFESPIRTAVYPGVLSSTLTVRLQVWGYVAFTGARYPKSISVVTGTGLAAPTF